jgi:flagellar motor protein MotB
MGEVPSHVRDVVQATGEPLEEPVREFMEARFGRDFGHVRLHRDARAAASAEKLNALAYTVGRHVVFSRAGYRPDSEAGRGVLAHELTHTLQQMPASAPAAVPGDRCRRAVPTLRASLSVQRLGDISKIPPGLKCTDVAPNSPHPVVDSIMFENRVSLLDDLNRAQIENFVRNWWAAGGNQPVRLDGFASRPGTDELNWRLSCDRAQAVARELMNPSSGSLPGVPQSFITIYMQGETDEFGDEAANRRVTLTLTGGGAGPPAPVPTPSPSPTGEEACRRARQAECVMRLGGCPNTRPGGIPSPEEITRYNAACREETGYTGPEVTPSDEECRSGSASPSVEQCRLARLEETHICGPDISQPLADVLADVRSTYSGWSATQRREACDAITGVPIPFVTCGFIMAWDIHELFLPETGWLCRRPYHPPCGMPPLTGCDNEDPSDCGNSVEVRGKCFLAGTVNYALFGQICRLCNDEFGVLSESTMENLILGWKALGCFLDDPGPPIAWARAGFRGFPGHIPLQENRGQCRGRCPVAYVSGPFTWVWEPHHPR